MTKDYTSMIMDKLMPRHTYTLPRTTSSIFYSDYGLRTWGPMPFKFEICACIINTFKCSGMVERGAKLVYAGCKIMRKIVWKEMFRPMR